MHRVANCRLSARSKSVTVPLAMQAVVILSILIISVSAESTAPDNSGETARHVGEDFKSNSTNETMQNDAPPAPAQDIPFFMLEDKDEEFEHFAHNVDDLEEFQSKGEEREWERELDELEADKMFFENEDHFDLRPMMLKEKEIDRMENMAITPDLLPEKEKLQQAFAGFVPPLLASKDQSVIDKDAIVKEVTQLLPTLVAKVGLQSGTAGTKPDLVINEKVLSGLGEKGQALVPVIQEAIAELLPKVTSAGEVGAETAMKEEGLANALTPSYDLISRDLKKLIATIKENITAEDLAISYKLLTGSSSQSLFEHPVWSWDSEIVVRAVINSFSLDVLKKAHAFQRPDIFDMIHLLRSFFCQYHPCQAGYCALNRQFYSPEYPHSDMYHLWGKPNGNFEDGVHPVKHLEDLISDEEKRVAMLKFWANVLRYFEFIDYEIEQLSPYPYPEYLRATMKRKPFVKCVCHDGFSGLYCEPICYMPVM